MKKLKITLVIALALVMVFGMTACSPSTDLNEDVYNKSEVIEHAKEMIYIVNTMDYEAVWNVLREDCQQNITPESIAKEWDETMQTTGEFEAFYKTTVTGGYDGDEGMDFAVVEFVCQYENGRITFTVTMDPNLEYVGIYME